MKRHITTSDTFIIADDEEYFTISNGDIPQNVGSYAFDKELAPDNVKYKTKEKYLKRICLVALSVEGI